jgi:hypothetical protein
LNMDFEQRGNRVCLFWEYPIGKLIKFLSLSRKLAHKIYAISHNSLGYNTSYCYKVFWKQRWVPQLIIDGTKLLSRCVENMHFLDFLKFLPMSLKSMPKSFDVSCNKGL